MSIDDDSFERLVDEKKLALISLMTAMSAEQGPDSEAVKLMLSGFPLAPGRHLDVDTGAAFRACADLIVYVTAILASEREESFETTWQRLATSYTGIISDRMGP